MLQSTGNPCHPELYQLLIHCLIQYRQEVFEKDLSPFLLVECKAPQVNINQSVFDQIARYNMPLKVPYLVVTNGVASYCCKMNYSENDYEFLDDIPPYPEIEE